MKMYALAPTGTNGHEAAARAAAWHYFAKMDGKIDIHLLETHREVLEMTEKHRCLGVVAIENGAAGFVHEVVSYWAHLPHQRSKIIAELKLPIHLQLLVHTDVEDFSQIRAVTSHEKALSQCAKNIARKRLVLLRPTTSTADAAWQLANGKLSIDDTAVLSSPFAGKEYGLKVMADHMEDASDNSTRFLVIGHRARTYENADEKTGVIFAVNNEDPLGLAKAEIMISCDGVNKSSLDRIRLGSKEDSVWYCEFDAHKDSRLGKDALTRLYTVVKKDGHGKPILRVLGSWPSLTA